MSEMSQPKAFVRKSYTDQTWEETDTTRLRAAESQYADNLIFAKSAHPHSADEAPTIIETDISPTLNGFDQGESRTNVLISSTAASLASPSAWPAEGRVIGMIATSGLSSGESCPNCSHDGSLLRMSQDFYLSTKDAFSDESSTIWGNSGSRVSPTWYWTRNISESRNAAAACSLSQVLQDEALSKYFLSAKAAAGILRRAERRGKALPPALEAALRRVASQSQDAEGKTTPTSSTSPKRYAITRDQAVTVSVP